MEVRHLLGPFLSSSSVERPVVIRERTVRFRREEPSIRLIAQRQSARLISERSGVRSPVGLSVLSRTQNCSPGGGTSKLAQRKRVWLMTRRTKDRNLHLLSPHPHCTYKRTFPFPHAHTPAPSRTHSKHHRILSRLAGSIPAVGGFGRDQVVPSSPTLRPQQFHSLLPSCNQWTLSTAAVASGC